MTTFDGCSCLKKSEAEFPYTIHWVAGFGQRNPYYHDTDGVSYLSFRHTLIRTLGWTSPSNSVLLRSLLAATTIIPISESGKAPPVPVVLAEWSRVTRVLADLSADLAQCVVCSGASNNTLFNALVDPRLQASYKGLFIQSHTECPLCSIDSSRCVLSRRSSGKSSLVDVFQRDVLAPVSTLLRLALKSKWAMIVDVQDAKTRAKEKSRGIPIEDLSERDP